MREACPPQMSSAQKKAGEGPPLLRSLRLRVQILAFLKAHTRWAIGGPMSLQPFTMHANEDVSGISRHLSESRDTHQLSQRLQRYRPPQLPRPEALPQAQPSPAS